MVPITELSHLVNPLATSVQLETSASQLDGVPKDLEHSIRFETARLLQAAGVLLRLPQELIAQSIITVYRFWTGADGGSLLEDDSRVCGVLVPFIKRVAVANHGKQDVAAAALYLTAKPSAHLVGARQTLVVFEYLRSVGPDFSTAVSSESKLDTDWQLSEGKYETDRNRLYAIEARVLRVLGFQTHVALPYTLCINYLQTLDVFNSPAGSAVAKRSFAHLNSALLSPQLLFLTHQPFVIATAAIYLAAREMSAKLPEVDWWEVFDVDREELGFLVVALTSVEGYALEEERKWRRRKVPLTVEGLRLELERRAMLDAGE